MAGRKPKAVDLKNVFFCEKYLRKQNPNDVRINAMEDIKIRLLADGKMEKINGEICKFINQNYNPNENSKMWNALRQAEHRIQSAGRNPWLQIGIRKKTLERLKALQTGDRESFSINDIIIEALDSLSAS